MSENIKELQAIQIETQEANMRYFNMKSFATNLLIVICIVSFTCMAHRFFVIKRTKIKGFHFLQNKKILIKTFEQFARTTWASIIYIGLNFYERENFIKKFGLEIFNFLNFEAKMIFLCGFCFVFVSIQSLFYFIAYGRKVNYLDFLVGDFHFNHYVGLMTLFAAIFAVSIYLTIALLKRDCRSMALKMLLSKLSESNPQYPYVKNLVFFSKLDQLVNKEKFEQDMSMALGIPKSRFLIILFPKMKRICKLMLKINQKTDVYYFWSSPKNPVRFFIPDPSLMTSRFFASLESLKIGLARESRKSLKYSGRGILLFFDFNDVEKLHRLRLKESQNIETEDPSPAKKLIQNHKFYFLCSYNDLVLPNVDKFIHSYSLIRVLLYAVLALVLLFVTTPLGILETLIKVGLSGGRLEDGLLVRIFKTEYGRYLVETIYPLLTYLINLLLILAIEAVGQAQRFARHSFYQEFIFRTSFIYLLINTMVMPAMLFGGSLSLFDFLMQAKFSFAELSFNMRRYETGNFFTNIILQSGSFSFISSLMIVGMLLRKRGSYDFVHRHFRATRMEGYRKEVQDLFEFGYNYSYDCAVIYIVFVFGLYQPLILFAGTLFFVMKAFANIGCLTGFFKEQVFMKSKMTDMAAGRLRFAVPLMFFILSLKCFEVNKFMFGAINMAASAGCFAFAFYGDAKTYSVADLLEASKSERNYISSITEFRSLYSRNDENYKQVFLEKIIDPVLLDRIMKKRSFSGETKAAI